MNISRKLVAAVHIVAMIAAGTVPAGAAGFARDAAGTEGRVLRSEPIRKPLPPISERRWHRFDRGDWHRFDRGDWHRSRRVHDRRAVTTPIIVIPVR
jgi:hypothetical protein